MEAQNTTQNTPPFGSDRIRFDRVSIDCGNPSVVSHLLYIDGKRVFELEDDQGELSYQETYDAYLAYLESLQQ